MPGRVARVVVAGCAALAAAACWDFTSAYQGYCDRFGCGPDGGALPPDSGSGSDAGASDSGVPDAGPPGCGRWGDPCASATGCCNSLTPPDAGDAGSTDGGDAGPLLGCNTYGFCDYRRQGCLPGGDQCLQNSDCCAGSCDAGVCAECGTSVSSVACSRATDCCFERGAECSAGGACVAYQSAGNDGAHCLSAAYCTSGYCQLPDGGVDGICAPPPSCTPLNGNPSAGGGPCCPGTQLNCLHDGGFCLGLNALCCSDVCAGVTCLGDGNNGNCCLPDGVPCPGYNGCCSGNCEQGVCRNVNVNVDAGMPCVTDTDCINQTPPMVCDYISGTCESAFCYPPQVAAPGACGTLRQQTGSPLMVKSDGTTCQFGANYCGSASECCTGKCVPCPTQPNRTCCTDVVRW